MRHGSSISTRPGAAKGGMARHNASRRGAAQGDTARQVGLMARWGTTVLRRGAARQGPRRPDWFGTARDPSSSTKVAHGGSAVTHDAAAPCVISVSRHSISELTTHGAATPSRGTAVRLVSARQLCLVTARRLHFVTTHGTTTSFHHGSATPARHNSPDRGISPPARHNSSDRGITPPARHNSSGEA
ncbi:unnamed protein product [Arabidopsis halleri]